MTIIPTTMAFLLKIAAIFQLYWTNLITFIHTSPLIIALLPPLKIVCIIVVCINLLLWFAQAYFMFPGSHSTQELRQFLSDVPQLRQNKNDWTQNLRNEKNPSINNPICSEETKLALTESTTNIYNIQYTANDIFLLLTHLSRPETAWTLQNIHEDLQTYYLWHTTYDQEKPTIICFSGNISTPYTVFEHLYTLSSTYNVVIPVYPGYFDTPGHANPTTVTQLADATYKAVRTALKNTSKIFVLGESIGSGPACYLASKYPLHLILNNGFSSFNRIVFDHLSQIWLSPINISLYLMDLFSTKITSHRRRVCEKINSFLWAMLSPFLLVPDGFNNLQCAKHFKKSVTIIHSEQDEIIWAEHSQRMHTVISASKSHNLSNMLALKILPDKTHNEFISADEIDKIITNIVSPPNKATQHKSSGHYDHQVHPTTRRATPSGSTTHSGKLTKRL
jgi:esterase/lipase